MDHPRILVVEDDPSIRSLAAMIIEKCDHWSATTVADGEEALRAWEGGDFDVVLMDLRLPHLDGISVAKRIREAERDTGRHTGLIAFTVDVTKMRQQECEEAGFDGFVGKPAQVSRIVEEIDKMFPQRFQCRPPNPLN